MHEAPLLADGADDGDRRPARLDERELHPRGHPAAAQLLPEVEGGLVDVEDLVVVLVMDEGS